MSASCHKCGTAITRGAPIARDAECASCGADLRCCRNCRFWDPHASNECRESEADLVSEKSRRNFCEYFELSDRPAEGKAQADRAAAARAGLDALFKKKRAPEGE